jgi:tetratricopeptide (TPR) repeat protein
VLLAPKGAKAADVAVADLRAWAEGVSDSHAEVLGWLDEVLADRPRHLEGRFLREEMLRSLSRPKEAAEDIRDEILLDGLEPASEFRARYRLADALEEIQQFADALEQWRLCLKLDPADETVPERIRLNFRNWRVREFKDAGDEAMKRGALALWAGEPETVLAAVPRPDNGENLPALALRGAALLLVGRPDQVREELYPALDSIPPAGDLDVFQREFLFALGSACLALKEDGTALRCLERLAREAPDHRSVRRVLDHAYGLKALGAERPFELTSSLEGVDGE